MMNYAAQKARLTRALKSGDPSKVVAECRRVKQEWNANYWPDDWSRWQRALGDVGIVTNLDDI